MSRKTIKVGTRASKLALVQTDLVKSALESACPDLIVEVVHVTTSGDKKQGSTRAGIGDKKDWILELEMAVLSEIVDIAVHSGKDVPADIEQGTALIPVLRRADPSDVFVGKRGSGSSEVRVSFQDIPQGGAVGTASKRRKAQLLRLRPDLVVREHRGNVPTRIQKLDNSDELFGIVLAGAGLNRLGLDEAISYRFSFDEMVPAVNQGIMAVQYRAEDITVARALSAISDRETQAVWDAERSCVERLGADCNSSVCVFAYLGENGIRLHCRILSEDGRICVEERGTAQFDGAKALGTQIADKVLAAGGRELI